MDTLFKSSWAFFPDSQRQRLPSKFFEKTYALFPDYVACNVFSSDFFEILKKQRKSTIKETNVNLPLDNPTEVSMRFYFLNRARRAHMNFIKGLQRHVRFILPGPCYDLVDFAFRLPYQVRSNTAFYRKLIRTWFPEIGAVPWDRTGKPLDRGTKRGHPSFNKLLFKGKYALQRATRGRIDLLNSPISFNRRFRTNKNFRGQILDILYDPRTLSRGFFERKGVERLVERELSGRDHANLFKSMISVEMLYRKFIDDSGKSC
jgi:hypothetical protein